MSASVLCQQQAVYSCVSFSPGTTGATTTSPRRRSRSKSPSSLALSCFQPVSSSRTQGSWSSPVQQQRARHKPSPGAEAAASSTRYHKTLNHRKDSVTPPPDKDVPPLLPNAIFDPETKLTYRIDQLLGRGGFAWCYEVHVVKEDSSLGEGYALKVIPRWRLTKPHHHEKVLREMRIHRSLDHGHVVKMYSAFEDNNNMYMLLELCEHKSLVNVIRTRDVLSEPETRHYLGHVLLALDYLHNEVNVLHRDVKLGNMMLSRDMNVKLGDFGLAINTASTAPIDTTVSICGTPNYIAPEVLQKKGHSVATEMWAVGCCLFAMLCGRPPFETNELTQTYKLITDCSYQFPESPIISGFARDLIRRFLEPKPRNRLMPRDALRHPFFTASRQYCVMSPHLVYRPPMNDEIKRVVDLASREATPSASDESVQWITTISTIPPENSVPSIQSSPQQLYQRAQQQQNSNIVSVSSPSSSSSSSGGCNSTSTRGQHSDWNNNSPTNAARPTGQVKHDHHHHQVQQYPHQPVQQQQPRSFYATPPAMTDVNSCFNVGITLGWFKELLSDYRIRETEAQLWSREVGRQAPATTWSLVPGNCAEAPICVTKWIDYTNRFGFGAQFSDGTVSITFNDGCVLSMNAQLDRFQFIPSLQQFAADKKASLHSWPAHLPAPPAMESRLEVWRTFWQYMDQNLIRGGDLSMGQQQLRSPNNSAGRILPFLVHWQRFEDEKSVAMVVSNGTVQVNYLSSHVKLALDGVASGWRGGELRLRVVSVDAQRNAHVYTLARRQQIAAVNGVVPLPLHAKATLFQVSATLERQLRALQQKLPSTQTQC